MRSCEAGHIKIINNNLLSLHNRIHEFHDRANMALPDVIAIMETWVVCWTKWCRATCSWFLAPQKDPDDVRNGGWVAVMIKEFIYSILNSLLDKSSSDIIGSVSQTHPLFSVVPTPQHNSSSTADNLPITLISSLFELPNQIILVGGFWNSQSHTLALSFEPTLISFVRDALACQHDRSAAICWSDIPHSLLELVSNQDDSNIFGMNSDNSLGKTIIQWSDFGAKGVGNFDSKTNILLRISLIMWTPSSGLLSILMTHLHSV